MWRKASENEKCVYIASDMQNDYVNRLTWPDPAFIFSGRFSLALNKASYQGIGGEVWVSRKNKRISKNMGRPGKSSGAHKRMRKTRIKPKAPLNWAPISEMNAKRNNNIDMEDVRQILHKKCNYMDVKDRLNGKRWGLYRVFFLEFLIKTTKTHAQFSCFKLSQSFLNFTIKLSKKKKR